MKIVFLIHLSPYSASKASAEYVCSSFQKTYGLEIKILRPANNYGIYQQPEKLIPFSIANLQKGNNIELYGHGDQVRHWLHVDDTCSGIIKVWNEGLSGQAYNIGSGEYFQNKQVVKKLLKILNLNQDRLIHVEDRPGHDYRYAIDISKINALGWKPIKTFEEELSKIVYWYQENIQFWETQHKKIIEKRKNRFNVKA